MSLLPLAMLIFLLLDFIMMVFGAPVSHRKSLPTMITKELLHNRHKRDTTDLQTRSRQKRDTFIPAGLVTGVIKMCDRHSFWCNHHIFTITDEITDRTVQISTGTSTTSSHAREIRSTDNIRNDPTDTQADALASADIVKSRRRRHVGMLMGKIIINMCKRHRGRCNRKRIDILDTYTGRRTRVRASHGRITASEY